MLPYLIHFSHYQELTAVGLGKNILNKNNYKEAYIKESREKRILFNI